MAKKPSFLDQLYLGKPPETPPLAQVGTPRFFVPDVKTKRDLNVRARPRAPTISTPRPNTAQRVSNTLRRVGTGGVGQILDAGEALTGFGNLYDSLIRGGRQVFYGDAYDNNRALEKEDATTLGLNALFGAAGPLGRGAVRLGATVLPEAVTNLAVRGVDWLRHTGGPLVDPDYIEGALEVMPTLAVKPKRLALPAPDVAELAVPRLTGPARPLALPAPGPGLPPLASKPRGGQFWTDRSFDGSNMSPEDAVRRTRQGDPSLSMLSVGDFDPGTGQGAQLGDWLERTLAKYYKTDFGAPEDPLRDLAERGLHYDPEMTPERWRDTVNSYLEEDTIGDILLPPARRGAMPGAGNDLRAEAMLSMPWLAKQPVTDNIYGISSGGLDLSHFTDEMRNAMDVTASGLPSDLAVRPESLGRMSFPQAVEQVGRINQYRAKEMEREALSNLNSPAVQTFKEYPENNPMGLRWTELKAPEPTDDLLDDVDRGLVDLAVKEGRTVDPAHMDEVRASRSRKALEDALKYEGDTMGHSVGNKGGEVRQGRSRIFSLRDAKGEPHVTIETKPYTQWLSLEHAVDTDQDFKDAWNQWRYGHDLSRAPGRPEGAFEDYLRENDPDLLSQFEGQNYAPDEIVQIKGKGNRAPKDDYLPFVQDFVKSQQWGNIGDLSNAKLMKLPDGRYINDPRNTQLVLLPDGRYITQQQAEEGIAATPLGIGPEVYDPRYLHSMGPDVWAKIARHFEGYAIGGRVSADRCFTRSPMSVR